MEDESKKFKINMMNFNLKQTFFKKIRRKILRFSIHAEHKIFDICCGKNSKIL